MKKVKTALKVLFGIIGVFLLYVIVSLIHGTSTDFQPEEKITIDIDKPSGKTVIEDSILTFLTWNLGYGGLGESSNFFYDNGGFFTSGGKMVRNKKTAVDEHVSKMATYLQENPFDFYLLQEIDRDSRRSYRFDQYEKYQNGLNGDYEGTFAVNYRSQRVPIPVCQPWNVIGKVESGLATYSKYRTKEATRYQFPGDYAWPTRIFQLDRCFALHRYPTASGKELIVINTHNSAYDKGGFMKKQQMDYLKTFLDAEYEKGNYVVVGGDWNQCPPNFKPSMFDMSWGGAGYLEMNIPADFMPEDWVWAFDPSTPTNRSLVDTYERGSTKVGLLDFFLVSPNLKVEFIKTVDLDFAFSDHQPVMLKLKLLEL